MQTRRLNFDEQMRALGMLEFGETQRAVTKALNTLANVTNSNVINQLWHR